MINTDKTEAIGSNEVSVVVPVFNGVKTIDQTIERLLNQTLPPLEIIIVDDGSTDQTCRLLKNFDQNITIVSKSNGGPASARNIGVKLAKGNLIAFTDSDCLPEREWLNNLVAGFNNPMIAGVGGKVKSAEITLISEFVDFAGFLNPYNGDQNPIAYLITANACFRKDVISQAGGFNEIFRRPGGEEPELCWRIGNYGYQFYFSSDAVVYHYHRQSITTLLATMLNYGEGAYRLGQVISDYNIKKPKRQFLQKLLSLKHVVRQIKSYKRLFGLKKAIAFSLFNYLKEVSFSLGYLRGLYRGT